MLTMRPRALALCVTAALAATAPASADSSRIAVVDVQHAVLATEDGMRAQATLKKLFDKRQADLDAKQAELRRMQDDIEKQQRVLSREALQKRTEDWQRRMLQLQNDFIENQKELQKKQGELTAPIIKKLIDTIARLAKKNGYEMVLDKQAAPYVRPDLDMTDQVIQLYNGGGAAEPAPEEKDKQPDK